MRFRLPDLPDGTEEHLTKSERRARSEAIRAALTARDEAYARHLEGMRGRFGDHVVELATLPGVDDGLIVEVHHDRTARTMTLTLRCGHLKMGYNDLAITYQGADIDDLDDLVLARLARSTIDASDHDADVAWHEIDVTEDGRIEHRVEFHVYGQRDVEIAIRCTRLEWERVPRPDCMLPDLPDRYPGGPLAEMGRMWRQR